MCEGQRDFVLSFTLVRVWLLPLSCLLKGKRRQEPQTEWGTLWAKDLSSFDTGVWGRGDVTELGCGL